MADQVTPSKTAAQRGWRTLIQNVGGALVGLLLAVWNTPGVPETVVNYAQDNFVPLLLAFVGLVGVPSAIIAYIQNKLEAKRLADQL